MKISNAHVDPKSLFCRCQLVLAIGSLMLVLGCGGMSTEDKFMEMARARSARNAAEEEENAAAEVAPPPAAATAEAATAPSQPPENAEASTTPTQVVASPQLVAPSSDGDVENPSTVSQTPVAQATMPRRNELLTFGRFGEQVAYVGANQSIGVFDVATKQIARQLFNPNLSPFSLSIGEEGQLLAAGDMNGSLKVFSLKSTEGLDKFQQNRLARSDLEPPRRAHDNPVTAVAVSDKAGVVVSGDSSGELKLWSSDTSLPTELTSGARTFVDMMGYQDDQLLFASTEDKVVYWQLGKSQLAARDFADASFTATPTVMVPGPGGKGLAVGDESGRITLWTPEGAELVKSSFSAHGSGISTIGFSTGGDTLVSVAKNGEVSRWSLPIQVQESFELVEQPSIVITSPNGNFVGASSRNQNLDLYNTKDGQAVRRHSIASGELTAAMFFSDSESIALGNDKGQIVFQNSKRQTVASQQIGNDPIVELHGSTLDNKQFAFRNEAGLVGVANLPESYSSTPSNVIGDVAQLSRSGAIAIVAKGTDLKSIETKTSKIITSATIVDDTVTSIAVDDSLAVIGTAKGSVWLWPYLVGNSTPEKLVEKLHSSPIRAIGLTRFSSIWSVDADGATKQTPLKRQTDAERGKIEISVKEAFALAGRGVVVIDKQDKLQFATNLSSPFKPMADFIASKIVARGDSIGAIDVNRRSISLFANDGSVAQSIRTDGDLTITSADISTGKVGIVLSNGSATIVSLPSDQAARKKIQGGTFLKSVISANGQVIVSRTQSGDIIIAGLAGGGSKLELPGQTNASPIALSADGRYLIASTSGRTLCYELGRQTPRLLSVVAQEITNPVAASISSDGKQAVLCLDSGDIHRINIANTEGSSKIATLQSPAIEIHWDDKNNRVLTRDSVGNVTLLDSDGKVVSGSLKTKFSSTHFQNGTFWLGSVDGSIYRWNAANEKPDVVAASLGGEIELLGTDAVADTIFAVTSNGQAHTIAIGTQVTTSTRLVGQLENAIQQRILGGRLVEMGGGGELHYIVLPQIETLAKPSSRVSQLAISGDGNWVIARSDTGKLVRWQKSLGAFSTPVPIASPSDALEIRAIDQGAGFAIASKSRSLSMYTASANSVTRSAEVDADITGILATSPGGMVIVKTSEGGRAVDLQKGTRDNINAQFSSVNVDDQQWLSLEENGPPLWILLAGDGSYLKTNRLSDQASPEQFALPSKPGTVAISGELLFAGNKTPACVSVYREDGSKFQQLDVSSAELACVAAHPTTASVAASDVTGRVSIVSGDARPVQSQLPFSGPTSITWSTNAKLLAVTDGQRIVTLASDTGKILSQLMIETKVRSLVGWNETGLWYIDGSSRLNVAHPAEVLWSQQIPDQPSSIAWSERGKQLVIATNTGSVIELDSQSGQELARVATRKSKLRGLQTLGTSDSMIMLGSNSELVRYEIGGQLTELPVASALGLRSVTSSSDGRWLYASNDAGKILGWDLNNLNQPAVTLPCDVSCGSIIPGGSDRLFAISRNSPRIASVSTTIMAGSGEQLRGQPTSTHVSSNGTFIASINASNRLSINSLIGKPYQELTAGGVDLQQLAVHPASTYVAAAGPASLTVVETESDSTDAPSFRSPSSKQKHQLVLWEMVELKETGRVDLTGEVQQICYSRDGGLLAVAYKEGFCDVIDTASLKKLESTPIFDGLQRVAFSQDGSKLILGGRDGKIRVQPLLVMGQVKSGSSAVVSLGFHGGGKFVLCATMDGAMTLWSRTQFNAPQAIFKGIPSPILQSKVSADGRYVLAVYEDVDYSTFIWDLEASGSSATSIEPKLVIRCAAQTSSAAFTSDSRFLLIGGMDGAIRAWSLSENREIARFTGHEGPVLDISPQSEPGHFVTGGIDHSIRTWRFPDSLPPPGAEIPQGALADATEVRELEPPSLSRDIKDEDPNDEARQALIAGAGTSDILDLMEGDQEAKKDAKQILDLVRASETSGTINAEKLSRERRQLASIQRKMSPTEQARTLATYSGGFSNLTFAADTNFQFNADGQFRPVRLLMSDRFVYAARPSSGVVTKKVDEEGNEIDNGDNGALLSWDYRYSRLQAHAWSIEDLNVQAMYPLPNSAGVFTVPQMMLFSQDGSSRKLSPVASWATSNQPIPQQQFLAAGTEGAGRVENDILKIFDVADFAREDVAPYSQYRTFEGIVTAMAFANNSSTIAFCVRERAVHRLFIADAATLKLEQLEEVRHDKSWLNLQGNEEGISRNDDAAMGITSLAFSPGDEYLVAHGQYTPDTFKFSRWKLKWDQGQLASVEKHPKDIESKDGPLFINSGNETIRFVVRSDRDGGDKGSRRILVKVADGFVVINLDTLKAERRIKYEATQHGWPEYSLSHDCRWLITGQDNGMAYIWDTLKGTRYCLTIDDASEKLIANREARLKEIVERPAHSGPILGVAFSQPDPGQDYPAFAATIGEENKIKVWELFPILDPDSGRRSRP